MKSISNFFLVAYYILSISGVLEVSGIGWNRQRKNSRFAELPNYLISRLAWFLTIWFFNNWTSIKRTPLSTLLTAVALLNFPLMCLKSWSCIVGSSAWLNTSPYQFSCTPFWRVACQVDGRVLLMPMNCLPRYKNGMQLVLNSQVLMTGGLVGWASDFSKCAR